MAQRVTYLPRTARYTGYLRDLAIVRNTTTRNILNCLPDTTHSSFAIHLTQPQPGLNLPPRIAENGIAIE